MADLDLTSPAQSLAAQSGLGETTRRELPTPEQIAAFYAVDELDTGDSVWHWSAGDVLNWLRMCHKGRFAHYASLFEGQDVDGEALMQLADVDLQALGMTNTLHRKALLHRVNGIKNLNLHHSPDAYHPPVSVS